MQPRKSTKNTAANLKACTQKNTKLAANIKHAAWTLCCRLQAELPIFDHLNSGVAFRCCGRPPGASPGMQMTGLQCSYVDI